jgi:hypothetical protein
MTTLLHFHRRKKGKPASGPATSDLNKVICKVLWGEGWLPMLLILKVREAALDIPQVPSNTGHSVFEDL